MVVNFYDKKGHQIYLVGLLYVFKWHGISFFFLQTKKTFFVKEKKLIFFSTNCQTKMVCAESPHSSEWFSTFVSVLLSPLESLNDFQFKSSSSSTSSSRYNLNWIKEIIEANPLTHDSNEDKMAFHQNHHSINHRWWEWWGW